MHAASIRPVTREDLSPLAALVDATGLFPGELLPGMTSGFLDGTSGDEQWLTLVDGAEPVAVAYVAPERLTSGTWNLLLIAVHPSRQGRGLGATLMAHVEGMLAARGERLLLVETSGLPEFARTRAFYLGLGYEQEARIRDFYQAGEDKVVFRKSLRPA